MKRTHKGRRSQMTRRIPKKIIIPTAIPKGSSLKISYTTHPTLSLLGVSQLFFQLFFSRIDGIQPVGPGKLFCHL
jgi:hypothetical protein